MKVNVSKNFLILLSSKKQARSLFLIESFESEFLDLSFFRAEKIQQKFPWPQKSIQWLRSFCSPQFPWPSSLPRESRCYSYTKSFVKQFPSFLASEVGTLCVQSSRHRTSLAAQRMRLSDAGAASSAAPQRLFSNLACLFLLPLLLSPPGVAAPGPQVKTRDDECSQGWGRNWIVSGLAVMKHSNSPKTIYLLLFHPSLSFRVFF